MTSVNQHLHLASYFFLVRKSFHKQRVAEYFGGSLFPPLLPFPMGLITLKRQLDAFSSQAPINRNVTDESNFRPTTFESLIFLFYC